MSKNIRRIVIAAAAVLVLALAFVLLKYVFPEKEVIIEETLRLRKNLSIICSTGTATKSPISSSIMTAGMNS